MIRHAPILLAALTLVACGNRHDPNGQNPVREEPRSRRVIEPPVGIVRPLPPHLISTAGVGPYRLGDRLADLLQQLPSGPRLAVFEIPGVLHRSLIRAEEDDSVLIGGESGSVASFVAVLDPQVARTESGIHVGSTREDLAKMGDPLVDPTRAHDPRIVIPAAMRNLRIVFPDRTTDRVAAIVVTADTTPPPRTADVGICARPADTLGSFGTCMLGSPPGELVTVDGADLYVRSADTERIVAAMRLPAGVVFVRPLRVEGRDELVVITRTDETTARTWSLTAYRVESGRLLRSVEPSVLYSISAANARWIGVELRAIDLVLELVAGRDVIEVGGLLTTDAESSEAHSPWRDVVVISPVSVTRRHGRSAPADGSSAVEGSAGSNGLAAAGSAQSAESGSAVPVEAGSGSQGSNGSGDGRSKP